MHVTSATWCAFKSFCPLYLHLAVFIARYQMAQQSTLLTVFTVEFQLRRTEQYVFRPSLLFCFKENPCQPFSVIPLSM